MCLIIFNWQPNQKHLLTLVSNRDEFHNRPSLDAHYWLDQPHIYGGRDLKKNGTWLAVSKYHRFAAVTNYRSPEKDTFERSRGEIPSQFLCSELTAHEFSANLAEKEYAGYNALLYDGSELIYCTNRNSEDDSNFSHHFEALPPGQYGLSNHLLNTPWHKIKRTKPALEKLHKFSENKDISTHLLNAFQDVKLANDENLPSTGISKSLEKLWSPAFITGPNYGTRTSTVVIMSKEQSYVQERQYKGEPNKFHEQAKLISVRPKIAP